MAKARRPTYTKKDIIRRVSAQSGQNMQTASGWVETVFTVLRETMMTADPELRIEIRDFGISLVKWHEHTDENGQARIVRSVLEGPESLDKYL